MKEKVEVVARGQEPPEVRRQRLQQQAIMRGATIEEVAESERASTPEVTPEAVPAPSAPTERLPLRKAPTVQVVLEYAGVDNQAGKRLGAFRLVLTVHKDICVRPNYISMLIASEVSLQPNDAMEFTMTIEQTRYQVYFVGGEFEFPSLGIRGISFLIKNRSEL